MVIVTSIDVLGGGGGGDGEWEHFVTGTIYFY